MKEQVNTEMQRLKSEIAEASAEFSAAFIEYEKRCKAAQIKLTHASGQLTVLVSLIKQKD